MDLSLVIPVKEESENLPELFKEIVAATVERPLDLPSVFPRLAASTWPRWTATCKMTRSKSRR